MRKGLKHADPKQLKHNLMGLAYDNRINMSEYPLYYACKKGISKEMYNEVAKHLKKKNIYNPMDQR